MKKEERYNTFWKYVLLIAGSILILIPLLATVLVRLRQLRISCNISLLFQILSL